MLLLGLDPRNDASAWIVVVVIDCSTIFDVFEIAISGKVAIISIYASIAHIRPWVGVVGVPAADLNVGGGRVDARLEKIISQFIIYSKLINNNTHYRV